MSATDSISDTADITAEEELYHIQESTNDDGTVDVEILGWEKYGNKVEVDYRLPTVEEESEQMQWPQKDSNEYKFVRLVRECGYDLAGAEHIVGSKVKCDGGLVVPKQLTWKERIKSKIAKQIDNIPHVKRLFLVSSFVLFLSSVTTYILSILTHDTVSTMIPIYIELPYMMGTISVLILSGVVLFITLLDTVFNQ